MHACFIPNIFTSRILKKTHDFFFNYFEGNDNVIALLEDSIINKTKPPN